MARSREPVWTGARRALAAAGDLVLPARCAACSAAGGPLCRPCSDAVRAVAFAPGPGVRAHPPARSGMPASWSGARLEGPLRLAVTAYKDAGRRDLLGVLARPLASALAAAAGQPGPRRALALGEVVLVVPVPTARGSRRRRGDDPVGALAAAATASVDRGAGGLVLAPALCHTRAVADQSHLGRAAREANLAGAMAVAEAWRHVVRGATCVLLDDVLTTGATLTEAARALRSAGARQVLAATCASTPRNSPTLPLWPPGPRTSVNA